MIRLWCWPNQMRFCWMVYLCSRKTGPRKLSQSSSWKMAWNIQHFIHFPSSKPPFQGDFHCYVWWHRTVNASNFLGQSFWAKLLRGSVASIFFMRLSCNSRCTLKNNVRVWVKTFVPWWRWHYEDFAASRVSLSSHSFVISIPCTSALLPIKSTEISTMNHLESGGFQWNVSWFMKPL